MSRRSCWTISVAVLIAADSLGAQEPKPLGLGYASQVNPLIGNAGKQATRRFGYLEAGFTFPGATYPFGMVQFTPTFFAPDRGFVVNQLSGAGCPNMGNFPIRVLAGSLTESPDDMVTLPLTYRVKRFFASHLGLTHKRSPNDPASHAQIRRATAGYYEALLPRGVGAELTVTKRTGMARFSFPGTASRGTVVIGTGSNATKVTAATVRITGPRSFEATADGGSFCDVPTPYRIHIVAEFDAAAAETGTWERQHLKPGSGIAQGSASGVYWTFNVEKRKVIQYKFAISYVSLANARLNLNAENPGWTFDETRSAAADEWNRFLGRIAVSGGSLDHTAEFYTHLYHALIHPSIASDVNGEYVGADHRVHAGSGYDHYTALSNWDAYRTQTPLLSLLAPTIATDVARSTIDFAQQSGGGFPRWALADFETGTMFGDPTSIAVANAYVFGARGFDAASALAIMRRGAEQPGTKSQTTLTRPLLAQYLGKGFVPGSMQLEYNSADFAIGQFALLTTGDQRLYKYYLNRSHWWTNLFNPARKWLQSRKPDGSWSSPEGDWVEASYKSYFWMVPYDLRGLIDTIGGARVAEERLDSLFRRIDAGYADEWFASGNEPDFHVPWIYNWVGVPSKTQAIVRRIIREQYHNRPDGLPGNDDMGAMGAWYVFSNIGLYPVIPGVAGFAVNSPTFPSITIHLGSGRVLTITGGSESREFIDAMELNGRAYNSTWLALGDIERGGLVSFRLSERPNHSWAIDAPPPSFR